MKHIITVAVVLAVSGAILGSYLESVAGSEAWTWALMVAMAMGASTIGSMVGLGGGLIIVPVLIFIGMSPPMAASASLAATLSNATASTLVYARQKRIDYREGIKMGSMASPGSILGAVWSSDVDPSIFGLLLATVLIVAAVYVFVRSQLGHRRASHTHIVMALSAAASFFAGIVSAFFGIGGGAVFVPVLVVVLGMNMMRAAPTSMFALILTSLTGVMTHVLLGHADAVLAMLLSAGGLVGGLAGARISLLAGEGHLRMIAAVFMVGVATKLVWDALSDTGQ